MGTGRLEAFSDGVIAIIVTIMVLELKVPHPVTLSSVLQLWPVFLSYALSFLVVAIMWVNHHHLLHTVKHVNAALLWFNVHLLFWMSLIPFTTGLMGEGRGAPVAAAFYALNLAAASIAFGLLWRETSKQHQHDSVLLAHHRRLRVMTRWTIAAYLLAAPLAFVSVYLSFGLFMVLPLLYFLPDRRLEAPGVSK